MVQLRLHEARSVTSKIGSKPPAAKRCGCKYQPDVAKCCFKVNGFGPNLDPPR